MLSRLSLLLCSIAWLCVSASAKLTNFTIDDASPAVVYTQTPILQCSPSSCPPGWIANTTFDGTATLTQSPIIVTFVGTPSTRQPRSISTKIEIIELIIASQDPKCTSSSPSAAAATSPSTVSTSARGAMRGRMASLNLRTTTHPCSLHRTSS
jgi:hypothetical protein